MKRVKLIATACAMAVAGVLANVAAQDFNTNERTFLTFSGAVELPGVTLQPGTYLFKLADSASNRHIVQVLSQDEKEIHATILAVPAERHEVTGENVVTFRETAEGATPAVQYWYYPGDRIGHEFVYPKDQAMRIAQRTGQDVLTADGDVASADTKVSSVGPDGEVSEWAHEGTHARTTETETGTVEGTTGVSEMPETPQAETSGETINPEEETQDPASETPPAEPMTAQAEPQPEAQAAPPAPVQEPAPAAPVQEEDRTVGTAGQLPQTASPLPLSGLIGLLSLGGAVALRRLRK